MSTHNPPILTDRQRKIHIGFRTGLIAMVVVASFLFAKELLFPTYLFTFRAAINSLANTISRPYVTEFGTTFDVAATGDFTKAHVVITLPDDAQPLPAGTVLSMRHAYRAFLAPISTTKYTDHIVTTYEIDGTHYLDRNDTLYPFFSQNTFDSYIFAQNTTIPHESAGDLLARVSRDDTVGFASGTLVKSQEGVFVIDGTTKHSFPNELAFLALGYNFDNVRDATNEERNLHEKASMMSTESTHPFGTIFYARDADRMYVYDHDQLNKIDPTIRAKQNAITVDEKSRTTFDSCTLSASPLNVHTYSCTMDMTYTAAFPGNIYQFMIDTPRVQIDKSRITLSTAPTQKSLEERIAAIKRKLLNTYTNE